MEKELYVLEEKRVELLSAYGHYNDD